MSSDLHMHTTFSDGRMTPEELLLAAKEAGLSYIAITDHDTIDGVRYLYEQGLYPGKGIKIIAGIEFSAHDEQHEVHILGYGIDIFHAALQEKLESLSEARWVRFSQMIEKLQQLGYSVTEADVLQIAKESKSISRSHVAQALVQRGYFKTVGEVFHSLLYKNGPAYVPHCRLEAAEIIALIRDAGGLSVLAHPLLVRSDELVQQVIDAGVDGLEVFYPQHDAAVTERYKTMAESRGLLLSGGSDFHAIPTRYPQSLGMFVVEDRYAEKFYRNV